MAPLPRRICQAWFASIQLKELLLSALVLSFSFILVPSCPAQLPSSRCSSTDSLANCDFQTSQADFSYVDSRNATTSSSSGKLAPEGSAPVWTGGASRSNLTDAAVAASPNAGVKEGFHWGPALQESFTFLAIEQAYVVKDDFRWVVVENGIPFNHYWRDYKQSLNAWIHSGWSDGDPNLYGYIGHPIQGAITSFIEIQNDPKSQNLEFANNKQYWWSRLKATAWNAVYSTQWNLGPISEVTVEKYGTKTRPPWNADGSYPCNKPGCLTGVGQIDIVMTPIGGFAWMVGEDWLDKNVDRRIEGATTNRFLIDTVRMALNPTRSGASILHGRAPWYRPRDHGPTNLVAIDGQAKPQWSAMAISPSPTTEARYPYVWNLFTGYSYTNSNMVTGTNTHLSGWNLEIEKKYFRFFGVLGGISGQYGAAYTPSSNCHSAGNLPGGCVASGTSVSQYNYLTGIRGGYGFWRLRMFAQGLVGAVHTSQTPVTKSNLGFTADLGAGFDLHLMPRFSLRAQADYLTTGGFNASQHNIRLSIGPAFHF